MIQLILGVCYFEAIMPYKQKAGGAESKKFRCRYFLFGYRKKRIVALRLFNSAFRANVRKAVKAQLGKTRRTAQFIQGGSKQERITRWQNLCYVIGQSNSATRQTDGTSRILIPI